MKLKFNFIFIFLIVFGKIYCQKYDSLDVIQVEKSVVTNPEKAFKMGLKVYNNSRLDDPYRIRLLFSMLNAGNQTQRLSDAIRFGTEGLALAKKSGNVISQIKFLGTLGNIYQSLQVNDKTKEYLNEAERLLNKNSLSVSQQNIKGNILYLKGMNYAYTLDCDMALKYFDQAIRIYYSATDPLSKFNIKLAYLNKASCLIELNNLKDAEVYLNLANRDLQTESSLAIPKAYSNIIAQSVQLDFAKVAAKKNNFELSNTILFTILKVQDQVNISDIETDIYFLLSENFLQLKDIQKSKYYNLLYLRKQSEKNEIQIEILNNLLSQEQNISDKDISQQNHNTLKWTVILIIAFSLIISFLILILKKIKRTNNISKKEIYSTDN